MSRVSYATTVVVLVGATMLAVCLFLVFGSIQLLGLFHGWHALGVPPEPAQVILRASYASVEVRAVTGQAYVFQPDWLGWMSEPGPPLGHWVLAESASSADLALRKVQEYRPFRAPYAGNPPATAKDLARFDFCAEMCWPIQYAVLDDGSVWYWSTVADRSALYNLGVWVAGGLALGFVLLALMSRRSAQRHP